MRTKNSFRNIIVALVGQSMGIVLQFISRKVFIDMMPQELLGLNSVFANLLAVLSLAEMGIGSAITFSLYKPLAEHDKAKIASIMTFYKRVYRVIAVVVTCFGALVIPFFPFIIKEKIDGILLYYTLYLASSVVSYLCAYKRTLIIADQKSYISSAYRYSYIVILNVVQIILLKLYQNYAYYLISQIVLSLLENILISMQADRMYPYLKEKAAPLERMERKGFFKNIRALLMHRIGSIAVGNTDNILLSAIESVNAVAVYSNYKLVFSGVNTIMNQVFSSVTASVGNLVAEKDKQYAYSIYKALLLGILCVFGLISICMVSLFNDFIQFWVGEQFVESIDYVIILVVHFFISGVREPTNVFKNALGLFWNDRYKAFIEAIINVILSIALGIAWGARGIFFATILSGLLLPVWIEPFVLYKNYFKKPLTDYFRFILKNVVIVLLIGIVVYFLLQHFYVTSCLQLILKALVCLILTGILMLIIFGRTPECRYFLNIARNLISKYRRSKMGESKL